jgi:hypothetical protein
MRAFRFDFAPALRAASCSVGAKPEDFVVVAPVLDVLYCGANDEPSYGSDTSAQRTPSHFAIEGLDDVLMGWSAQLDGRL